MDELKDVAQEKYLTPEQKRKAATAAKARILSDRILQTYPVRVYKPRKRKLRVHEITPLQLMSGAGGMTDLKAGIVYIPVVSSVLARHIREHEALHLRHSKGKPRHDADQAAEDARIEMMRRHITRKQLKETLAIAILTLRKARRMVTVEMPAAKTPEDVSALEKGALILAFRSIAQLVVHGGDVHLRWVKAQHWIKEMRDGVVAASFSSALFALLKPLQRPSRTPHWKAVIPFNVSRLAGDILYPLFAGEDVEIPIPGTAWELPITVFDLTTGPQSKTLMVREPAPSRRGVSIIGGRLVSAYLNPGKARVFQQQRLKPGASIVIDASGSMHFTSEQLRAICDQYPAANIMYYTCYSSNYGAFFVYAKDGRCSTRETLPHIGGGNEVDYSALHWLLDRPAPRFFVTDRQFCGGRADEAIAEFDQAVKDRRIKWVGANGHLKRGDI